jgi:hypothetical protein
LPEEIALQRPDRHVIPGTVHFWILKFRQDFFDGKQYIFFFASLFVDEL